MKILEITDKKIWNDFIGAQKYAQFLQSWEWGEFHEKMGRKVLRLAVVEKIPLVPPLQKGENGVEINRVFTTGGDAMDCDEILFAAQIIKYKLPFGQSYLYAPRGPIISRKSKVKSQKLWKLFYGKIKDLARTQKSMFFRFEPMEENELKVIKLKVYKVKGVQPENEWLLDLEKTEDELLKEMQQKTRYNIRLAQKKGIQIKCGGEKKYFEEFWRLIAKTYDRKDIRTHTRQYYQGILDIKDKAQLWVAEYEGKIIAGNVISFFGDTATYMHGGADYEMRNFMSPYSLQWELIKEAKRKGYRYYDFGGISEKKAEWEGITKFKKGFSGFELNYGGTYEIPLSAVKYGLYKVIKAL